MGECPKIHPSWTSSKEQLFTFINLNQIFFQSSVATLPEMFELKKKLNRLLILHSNQLTTIHVVISCIFYILLIKKIADKGFDLFFKEVLVIFLHVFGSIFYLKLPREVLLIMGKCIFLIFYHVKQVKHLDS